MVTALCLLCCRSRVKEVQRYITAQKMAVAEGNRQQALFDQRKKERRRVRRAKREARLAKEAIDTAAAKASNQGLSQDGPRPRPASEAHAEYNATGRPKDDGDSDGEVEGEQGD